MKDNCVYSVDEVLTPPKNWNVLFDEIVLLTGTSMKKKYQGPLLRITVENPETGENIFLLTSHLRYAPNTIGEMYRDRSEIALLQDTKAEPEGQNLHRRDWECPSHLDFVSPYFSSGDPVAVAFLESRVVLSKNGDHASAEPLYRSGFTSLVR